MAGTDIRESHRTSSLSLHQQAESALEDEVPSRTIGKSSKESARDRRNRSKLIRFTEDELRVVKERARVSGRPVACFIRESSLGPAPRGRRTDLNDSLIRTLAQVASRLTSLAATAKAQQLSGAAEFENAVSAVLEVIRSLD